MVAAAKQGWGGLDAAFNNAGISDSATPPPTHEYPLELWHKILDIDLSGVFYCLRYEIPLMLEGGGGATHPIDTMCGYSPGPLVARNMLQFPAFPREEKPRPPPESS
jgi:NAD(P)-dependent dehydrogenase (short-subunit alcohol dehydrogenase family)